jgi:gliding motility-associated-like protein
VRKYLLFLISIFALFAEGYSTHLVGGTTHYEYLGRDGSSNNFKYKVYITAYRDCIRGEADFDETILVCVYRKDGSLLKSETFYYSGEVKVEPIGNTNCPDIVNNVCIKKTVYTKTITLPSSTQGYNLKWERCCRNDQVNLPNGNDGKPKYGQTYHCFIPPTNIVNSSPVIKEVPVPFMCLNDTVEIRNRAEDPDGDSLVYSFVQPWAGASPVPGQATQTVCPSNMSFKQLAYKSGYSYTKPFGSSGVAKIDKLNGLTTYMSPLEGNFAVAVEIKEYRNNVLLSTTRLDLQILVIKCTPNKKPYFTNTFDSYDVNAGEQLCFSITGKDDDFDKLTLKGIGDIFSGTNGFTGTRAKLQNASGTGTVTSTFCWTPDCEHARNEPYVFTVEILDDGCPSKFKNKNFYIYVKKFKSNVNIDGPVDVCANEKGVEYRALNGASGSSYSWEVDNGTIASGQGTDRIFVDWGNFTSGRVKVTEISATGCGEDIKVKDVVLYPAPPTPNISGKDTVCARSTEGYTVANIPGATYKWIVNGGNIIGPSNTSTVVIGWPSGGNGSLRVVMYSDKGCASDTGKFDVFVSDPASPPLIGPKSVCPNVPDIEYSIINPNPGSSYMWSITGGTQTGGGNSEKILVTWGEPVLGSVQVREMNKFGCLSPPFTFQVKVGYDLDGEVPKGPTSICENEIGVVYNVTKTNRSRYEWTVTGGTIVSGQWSNEIIVDWGAPGDYTVSVLETSFDSVNMRPCVGILQTLPVTVNPNPTTVGIFGTFEVCQHATNSGTFSVQGWGPSTYRWTINGSTNGVIGQGTNQITIPYSAEGSFAISVVEISEHGCLGEALDTTLIIHPKPRTSPILGPAVVCFPDIMNKQYSVTGFQGSTFEWWVERGDFTSQNGDNVVVDWRNEYEGSISVLETSDFGCLGDTIKLPVVIDDVYLKLDVVTVNPPPFKDDAMLLNWHLINGDRYNKKFYIQKKVAGSANNFVTIDSVDGTVFNYLETPLNTDETAFEYRILGYNMCGDEILSDIHTNVLLTGDKVNNYTSRIQFSDYLGWGEGVSVYEIHRMLPTKSPYELYDIGGDDKSAVYENGLEHFTQCYRVRAIESNGTNEESWSNEVCFDFDPVIYVPNAFTPNDNGLNDYYLAVGGSLKTMSMQIYNRWGEMLFESNDLAIGWDGTFNGSRVQNGVYMYVVNYTGYDDTSYQLKGTVTLIR